MKKNILFKNNKTTLEHLQHEMQKYYTLFQLGLMTEKEYLAAIKPIDKIIDTLEISILKEYFVLKEASSALSHVPEK